MENYIVRVLRRETGQGGEAAHLDGVVEVVESGQRRAFHNANELWSILGEENTARGEQVVTLRVVTAETTEPHED